MNAKPEARPWVTDDSPLLIVTGVYGAEGGTYEVTSRLQAMVNEDGGSIDVNNANFGNPKYGVDKILSVVYYSDGQLSVQMGAEGTTITLAASKATD